jgi:2,4-dienoyl-CoA reductase (NADPH2)
MARRIPGKEEFAETLRYFRRRIEVTGVRLKLHHRADVEALRAGQYDDVVLATGVKPRSPGIDGEQSPKTLSYVDVLMHSKPVGGRVAIVGAGGIGFDVAEFLTSDEGSVSLDRDRFLAEWGVSSEPSVRGGVAGIEPRPEPPARQVYLLQRKNERLGRRLAKTTGWIHRAALKHKQVEMIAGVSYRNIDERGLHIEVDGETRLLEVDHVVLCAGQESRRDLYEPLTRAGVKTHLIGGADLAAELDAKRAIDQGTRLAAKL